MTPRFVELDVQLKRRLDSATKNLDLVLIILPSRELPTIVVDLNRRLHILFPQKSAASP